MLGLYKDPQGEKIFRSTPVVSNLSVPVVSTLGMPVVSTLGVPVESVSTLGSDEVPRLRKQIRDLENEVKEIKRCMLYLDNLFLYFKD